MRKELGDRDRRKAIRVQDGTYGGRSSFTLAKVVDLDLLISLDEVFDVLLFFFSSLGGGVLTVLKGALVQLQALT